jgi:hypothetical protein
MHVAVLPCAEPQQHDVQVVRPRAGDNRIYVAVIEPSRLWFELLPIHRCLNRIGVKRLHGAPHLRQLAGPSAGVVNLASEDQERLALDQQRIPALILDNPRRFGR